MTNKAIDTVHTMTMKDGTIVTTTWHDTIEQANARIAAPLVASFRKVFPCGILGAFRAVTWESAKWRYQNEAGDAIHEGNPTDERGLRLRAECGYTHVHMGTADGWLQISVAARKVANYAKTLQMIPVVTL